MREENLVLRSQLGVHREISNLSEQDLEIHVSSDQRIGDFSQIKQQVSLNRLNLGDLFSKFRKKRSIAFIGWETFKEAFKPLLR